MNKHFVDMNASEQDALRNAHSEGLTIELFNANMGVWMVTYRPTFERDLSYRIAEKQAPTAPSYQRG